MEEELENTELDLETLRTRADVLFVIENYSDALEYYLKFYNANPKDLLIVNKIATCYLKLKKYDNAIKYYDRIFNLGEILDEGKLLNIYFYRGLCYYMNRDYNNGIDDFLECIKILPGNESFNLAIGDCYFKLNKNREAVEYLRKSKTDVLEILRTYKNRETVSLMLDAEIRDKENPTLFSKAISDGGIEDINSNEYKAYKNIYIKVLEIIALLHVDNSNEKSVAHYTRISTAEQLIFNDSPFRLNTILTANDPKEGLDLFEFLGLNKADDESSDFQAFIGSFTFNHDSLNQFRLYGKEDNKEATGISLVFNEDFFNGSIVGSVKTCCVIEDKKIEDKKSLFRCIYVDPVSKQLISIGQREKWTFYRENKENITRADRLIKSYRRDTDEIFKKVKTSLNELKNLINKLENKKNNVLSELLLMLRYLTKNMAFKEEQECRVMTIENIANNQKILPEKRDGDFTQMYIEYRTVKDCIEKVYFAPKAKGKEMFNIQIKRFGLNIRSHESTHKIS